jgi:Holliday junction resolvase RusA-like endonuclease
MPSIKVVVPFTPATTRPKIAAGGQGMYNVPKVKQWKEQVKEASFLARMVASVTMPAKGVPVRADYNFYLQWQKNAPKKVALTNGAHTEKPDLKNLLSHTEDALTDADMWADDAQVDTITLQKFRCPRGEERVEITISW